METIPQHAYFGEIKHALEIVRGVETFWTHHPEARGWILKEISETILEIEPVRGLVTAVVNASRRRLLSACKFPIVDTSNAGFGKGFAQVLSDDTEVGRLAAHHLLEKGYRDFIYCAMPGVVFSTERETGFGEVIRARGLPLKTIELPGFDRQLSSPEFQNRVAALTEHILEESHGETAVFFPSDSAARDFLETAQPKYREAFCRIGIMGVDAIGGCAELANGLHLSSVQPAFQKIGYEAAALLDRILRQENTPPHPIRIAPLGVVEGNSTLGPTRGDRIIQRALDRIDAILESGDPVTVDALAKWLGVTRRTLLRKFQDRLGRGVKEEILSRRMKRATAALGERDAHITEIALRFGYSSQSDFSRQFRQHHGHSPRDWRKRMQ